MRRVGVVVVLLCGGCGGDANEAHDASPGRSIDAAESVIDGAPLDASTDVFDAGIDFDGAVSAGACNPVTQQGCDAGEKCSWLVISEDPFLGRTDCVPDGTVEIGGACTEGTPGETTGYDDCVAGGLCLNGLCRAICTIDPDTCGDGFACSSYTNTFSDDPNNNLGVCDPICDPVAQDCEDTMQGCYLQLFNGKGTCAAPAPGAETLTQGDTCANDGVRCYLNGCAIGYGGFLFAGGGVPRDCTAFCSPVETYLVDPDGDGAGSLVAGADANGAAPIDCSEARIGVLSHQCRFFQSYFIDQNANYIDYVSATYGFCAPRDATYGNCNRFSEEWFLESYNLFIEGGGDPSGWGNEITTLCDARVGGCASGCAKVETLDALDMAYCAVPANSTRPACASGLLGARIVRRSLERYWAEQLIRARAAARQGLRVMRPGSRVPSPGSLEEERMKAVAAMPPRTAAPPA